MTINNELTLPVAEQFYSLQCEGVTNGYPAYFMRLSGCNLCCGSPNLRNVKDKTNQDEIDAQQDPNATWTCFPTGTQISTQTGKKPIEKVKRGHKILSFNTDTKLVEVDEVEYVQHKKVSENDVVTITFKDENNTLHTITSTKEHLFYIKNKWIKAEQIMPGMEIYHLPLHTEQSFITFDKSYVYTEDYKIKHSKGLKNVDWEKISERMYRKNPMKNVESRIKCWSNRKQASKVETYWASIFKLLKLPLTHTNNKIWIGDKNDVAMNPDFKVINQKKVIEIIDSSCNFRDIKEYIKTRTKNYKKYGYTVLFLDVKKDETMSFSEQKIKLLQKVGTFIFNGLKVVSVEQGNSDKKITVYDIQCKKNHNFFAENLLVHNCDSIAVWLKRTKKSYEDIVTQWQQEGVLNDIISGRVHVIWTGGEPLMHDSKIVEFMDRFKSEFDYATPYYEIETNGTKRPSDTLLSKLHQINCSPKLANSAMPLERRLNKDAIKYINWHNNSYFKFVVSSEDDIKEAIDTYIKPCGIDPKKVILMPGLSSQQDYFERTKFCYEMAKKYKYIGISRGHIAAWDRVTGV
jgi:7-carboxy-7-deazaguanine synthase